MERDVKTQMEHLQEEVDKTVLLVKKTLENASKCKICGGHIDTREHDGVVCEHHEGLVHHHCCTRNCSWHGAPCVHAHGIHSAEKKEKQNA